MSHKRTAHRDLTAPAPAQGHRAIQPALSTTEELGAALSHRISGNGSHFVRNEQTLGFIEG